MSEASSYGNTASLGVHSRRNIHRRQLLEHQLGSIGNDDLRNLGLVLARSALEGVLLEGSVNYSISTIFHLTKARDTKPKLTLLVS